MAVSRRASARPEHRTTSTIRATDIKSINSPTLRHRSSRRSPHEIDQSRGVGDRRCIRAGPGGLRFLRKRRELVRLQQADPDRRGGRHHGRLRNNRPGHGERQGRSLLTVEQRVDLALQVCDRLYVPSGGAIVQESQSAEVDPESRALIDAYLG
jgi:hypothetical protein